MTTIWKFPIQTTDRQVVSMPKGSEILCVQTQHGQPCLWARVDSRQEKQDYPIRIFGTGQPCGDVTESRYLGSYQLLNGDLVFHVFVELSEQA